MQPQNDPFDADEIPITDYLAVFLRGWWAILAAFMIALVVAGATSPPQPPDVFEARTRAAIPGYILNSGILNQGGSVPLGLNAIAAQSDANLEAVIQGANLRNAETGQPWSVGQLAELTSVRPADADSAQELTLSVRSQDPLLAKQILEAWTEVFVENSNLLIEAKLSQSNRLKFSQYEKAGLELAAKEEERLSYLRQNSLALLVSGREVSLSQFGDVTDQLNRALGELVDVRPRLDSIRSALAVEPRLLVLDQMIKDQTLLTILADEINNLEPEQYLDLTLTTELPNDVYISLRQEEVRLESEQAALTARIAFMEGELAEFESDIESQSIQINTTELGLKRINRELGILEENFDRISRAIQPSLLDLPELSESFLESDPVSEPRIPISSPNQLSKRLILGGVVGLVLGAASAFAMEYVRRLREKRPAA